MKKIILVGNPNTGKTTLFNTIAGANEKTGNYSGVTVSAKERKINLCGKETCLVDLPGLYCADTPSADEQVTLDYLKSTVDGLICFVMTSVTLAKNLYLLSSLPLSGKNVCLFINDNGLKLSNSLINKIESILKIKIYYGDVRKNRKQILSFLETVEETLTSTEIWKYSYNELLNIFNPPQISINKLDRILLNKFWGKIIFFACIVLVFFISFGSIGQYLCTAIENLINDLGFFVCSKLNAAGLMVLSSFTDVVLVKALGSIICFVPQLVLLLLQMYLLEDIGYLPRVAYLFNIPLSSINLNGKSVFSMVVGIGCTTSAYMVTRNIGSNECRRATARFLPFVGCSAKLPIVLYCLSVAGSKISLLYIFLIYTLLIMFGIALLKLKSEDIKGEDFIVELPRLKRPSLRASFKQGIVLTLEFLKRVAGVLFCVSAIIWLLSSITVNLKFSVADPKLSLLYLIANKISYLFYPIGLMKEEFVIALISGLIAKENIISTINLFGGLAGTGTISIISFLIFVLFYPPCVPALKNCKNEFGRKFMWETAAIQFLLAYSVCLTFYTFSKMAGLWLGFVMCFILVSLVLSYAKIRKLNKNFCINCKKLYKN